MFIEVHTLYKAKAVKNKALRFKSRLFQTKKEAEEYAKKQSKKNEVWFSSVVFGSSVTGKLQKKTFGVVPAKYNTWK